jgi:uncharacterized protein
MAPMRDDDDGTIRLAPRRAKRQGRERACPMCGKPSTTPFKPFCSARCRQIDLGRWLSEGYRIETEEQPEEPATAPPAPSDES